ncbi:MAG TPA: hypothetical protein VGQ83_07720, partial [Polyangia bacterium]
PRRPDRDERLLPLAVALPDPTLDEALLGDEARLAELFAGLGLARPYPAAEADVDTTLYAAQDRPAVLFVGTRAARPLTATITLPAPARLTDLISGETLAGDGTAAVALPAYGVRLFRVDAPAPAGEEAARD